MDTLYPDTRYPIVSHDEISDWQESADQPMPGMAPTPPVVDEKTPPADPETQPLAAADTDLDAVDEPVDDKAIPESEREPRDAKGRFQKAERHRAKSQQATAADVPRIAKLTKELRQAQAELQAIKEAQAAKAPASPPSRIAVPDPPPDFTTPEPKIEDFAHEADPYEAMVLAKAEWRLEKKAHAQAVESHKKALEQSGQQADWTFQQIAESHGKRLDAFRATVKDWDAVVLSKTEQATTPIMQAACMLAEDGPAFIYYLGNHPDFHDELFLLTDGKPVTEATVASLQRRLRARVQAAPTGSAASPVVVKPAPRPPNPVRTVPQAAPKDLPGDDDSLEAHEKAFGIPRGRRHMGR